MSVPPPKPPRQKFNLGYLLLIALAIGALAYVIWALKASWSLAAGSHMSANGWIALAIAFVVTGLLGGGLMWLAFYSSRKGYDDNVGRGGGLGEPFDRLRKSVRGKRHEINDAPWQCWRLVASALERTSYSTNGNRALSTSDHSQHRQIAPAGNGSLTEKSSLGGS